MDKSDLIPIELCMGSACFARGNRENLAALKKQIEVHGLTGKVDIRGSLCTECCKDAPVIKIDGTVYSQLTPVQLCEIISQIAGGKIK